MSRSMDARVGTIDVALPRWVCSANKKRVLWGRGPRGPRELWEEEVVRVVESAGSGAIYCRAGMEAGRRRRFSRLAGFIRTRLGARPAAAAAGPGVLK